MFLMSPHGLRTFIFFCAVFLSGCFDPAKLIFGNHETATITIAADRLAGHYNYIPVIIDFTFPSTVDMNSVSLADFAVKDTCASSAAHISSVVVTGQIAELYLSNVSGCSNGETVTVTINQSQILMVDSSKNLSGSVVFEYQVDSSSPTVSAAINTVSGVASSGTYGFGSVPTSAVFSFSTDTDLSTVTAGDFTIYSTGVSDCGVLPTIGTLLFDSVNKTVTVPLTGAICADGQGFVLTLSGASFADSTLDAGSGSSLPNYSVNPTIYITVLLLTSGVSVVSVGDGVSSPSGLYGVGAPIDIVVAFDQNVDVTGIPRLQLNISGGATRYADYVSGTGTTDLIFTYSTVAGDTVSDLDYASNSSLQLNGGTLSRSGSNGGIVATRTLPLPGAVASLGYFRDIAIDTIVPGITTSNPVGPTDSWGNSSRTVSFTFNKELDPATLDTGDLSIAAGTCSGSLPTVMGVSLTGVGNNVVEFSLTSLTCLNGETYTLSLDPTLVSDLAANAGSGSVRSLVVTTTTTQPIISVGSPSRDFVNSLGTVTYAVSYSGASQVTLADTDISINGSSAGCTLSVTGSGLTTRYISITNCSGDGPVQIDIAADTAVNTLGNFASAVSESSIVDFSADNTELPDPTFSLPTIGLNSIYDIDFDSNFTLSFAGDNLGAQAALQTSLSLLCDTGGGANTVSLTATRVNATTLTVSPNETSPDFVYDSSCSISGSGVPDAADNVHGFLGLPFKVAKSLSAMSGPSSTVSISSATLAGDLGNVVFNVPTDPATITTSNVLFECDSLPIAISSLTPSINDTTITIDFDEADSNWQTFIGGEACTLTFATGVSNSLGMTISTPEVFNFNLMP